MKNQVYCVFNKVSERFGDTFASANNATAIRELSARVGNSPLIQLDDLCLYNVGSVDIESGNFEVYPKKLLCNLNPSITNLENELSKSQ